MLGSAVLCSAAAGGTRCCAPSTVRNASSARVPGRGCPGSRDSSEQTGRGKGRDKRYGAEVRESGADTDPLWGGKGRRRRPEPRCVGSGRLRPFFGEFRRRIRAGAPRGAPAESPRPAASAPVCRSARPRPAAATPGRRGPRPSTCGGSGARAAGGRAAVRRRPAAGSQRRALLPRLC